MCNKCYNKKNKEYVVCDCECGKAIMKNYYVYCYKCNHLSKEGEKF